MNPYKILRLKAMALLQLEAQLKPEERKANEWFLTVAFCDTRVLIGKGDVNTMFYQFGDGQRKVCYPDELLAKLHRLERQAYVAYRVGSKTVFSEKLALKIKPKGSILGLLADGSSKTAYKAKPTLSGVEWVAT